VAYLTQQDQETTARKRHKKLSVNKEQTCQGWESGWVLDSLKNFVNANADTRPITSRRRGSLVEWEYAGRTELRQWKDLLANAREEEDLSERHGY
jgi:hypothetical protein